MAGERKAGCPVCVLNYEEGAENNVLHEDDQSEVYLSEIVGLQPLDGQRQLTVESLYEYGARKGVWRLLRLFSEHDIPLTVFGVGMALERNPEAAAAMAEAGHEVASHGWRWIDYHNVPLRDRTPTYPSGRRDDPAPDGSAAVGLVYPGGSARTHAGWSPRKAVFSMTRILTVMTCPIGNWSMVNPQLIVPYTLDANDMKFASYQGFGTGEDFFSYLKDTFDRQYEEGSAHPTMMSIGLHCRIAGRPGRTAALSRFLDHVRKHDDVWVCQTGRHRAPLADGPSSSGHLEIH